jgi:hypothetical protein
MPAHKVHQLAVLHGLRSAGESSLMAFEFPHDQLLQEYEMFSVSRRTRASDTMLRAQDEQG